MAIEKVSETVTIGPRPGFTKTSVCSHVQYEGFKRHKAEVTFRPCLFPEKYSDTVYVFIDSPKKRYVSKTFYRPRLQPKSFAETTFACPKSKQEVFVTYLDQKPDENRKWFKTSVEIPARAFRPAQIVPSPTDINSNSFSAVDHTLLDQRLANSNHTHLPNEARIPHSYQNGGGSGGHRWLGDHFDPGASQVYIPKQKFFLDGEYGEWSGDDQHWILDFQHSSGAHLANGNAVDYSDV